MANTLDLGRVALDGADLNTLDYLSYDSTNGKIDTTKPIVETMSGYSIIKLTGSGTANAVTSIYTGISKNGNKITMVFFFSFAMATGLGSAEIFQVNIPSDIGSKLYPFTLGGEETVLDIKPLNMYYDRYNPQTINIDITKASNTRLYVQLLGTSALTDGKTYLGRYEATFLLSDNLTPTE